MTVNDAADTFAQKPSNQILFYSCCIQSVTHDARRGLTTKHHNTLENKDKLTKRTPVIEDHQISSQICIELMVQFMTSLERRRFESQKLMTFSYKIMTTILDQNNIKSVYQRMVLIIFHQFLVIINFYVVFANDREAKLLIYYSFATLNHVIICTFHHFISYYIIILSHE